jgi:hypothetical protein
MNEIEGEIPDILPVYMTFSRCEIHGYYLVSVPRNAGEDAPFVYKCPIRSCNFNKAE